MKTLACTIVALLSVAQLQAATVRISGTLSWKIQKPECTYQLDGSIQNLSGFTSGSLKLVLWATPAEFPSRGYVVSELNLGQLAGGYQMNSFTKRIPVDVPELTGNFYFTIAVQEYTTSGWLNRDYVTTGRKLLDNGEFVTGKEWLIPTKAIVTPPAKLKIGNKFTLSIKADADLDRISDGTRSKTAVTIQKNREALVVLAGDDDDYFYTYTTGKSTISNDKVPAAKLYLDPQDRSGSSTITLFFQSSKSGVYKNVETNPDGGETTWGTFSLTLE